MSEELVGYRGPALDKLRALGAKIGDTVRVTTGGRETDGVLMPRTTLGDDKHIVLKLKTGYNVGVRVSDDTKVTLLSKGAGPSFTRPPAPTQRGELPQVSIISTGGTIASKVDYRTGAVEPALTAEDLYSVVPELADVANVKTQILYSIFSENFTPLHWAEIASTINDRISSGARGVVVAQGTDTMGYTAAALSFALQDLPVPVVIVGSQRSSDRPSSDAATNLIGAAKIAAEAPFAEVTVAMHEGTSDDAIAVHRGTKVRKCHTSRRDAFRSVNSTPLARLELGSGKLTVLVDEFNPRSERKPKLKNRFEEKVALIKSHPGLDPRIIDWYVANKFRGIVLEGTGLGHISHSAYEPIRRAIASGAVVAMTSQCLWGTVDMNVYSTGRDLVEIGVIPMGDILPETALVKLMWVLGHSQTPHEVSKILATNIAHELSERRISEDLTAVAS